MLPKNQKGLTGSIKSLQATATALSVSTMIARLNIIIPSEDRLPWLCLSFGRWARMRSRTSNPVILLLALLATIALPVNTDSAAVADSPRSDMEQLQGRWKLVYQQMDGKKLPDEQQAEMFHGKMVFTGDTVHYSVELPGFDFKFSYRLHPDEHPKGIDLTLTETPDGKGVGQTMLGIYRLDGGTLEICHSRTNRPTDFTAGEGTQRVLIVLKRAPDSQ